MIQGGTAVQIGVVVVTVGGLWIGARLLVDAVVRLARRVGLSELTIGLTIVAAGTSTPELVVTTDAAIKGIGDIAVGNIVGSNIYNLAFILGVVSLIRVVPIERSLVHRDGLAVILSSLAGAYVVLNTTVSRLEGSALLVLYAVYTLYLLRTGSEAASDRTADQDAPPGVPTALTERVQFRGRDAVLLIAGLVLVLVSGDLMVGAATELALDAGISEWVIGGTIVAAGTSTPEFAVSLVAMRQGRLGVSVGNVVGSNVFNVFGILGIAAVIGPLTLSVTPWTSLAWLIAISVLMIAALWSGRRLSRAEGGLFAGSEVVRWVVGLLGYG
jgi:cation:H+ antiporter